MRTFDYRRLPAHLFDGKVGAANTRLYEDKGKLALLEQLQPERLELLRERAHFDNVDASTRIEGLYVDTSRVRNLIKGAEAADEVESQIVGYSRALRAIQERSADIELSTSTIVGLYEVLYAHRELGRKSRYRKKDYMYVQVDGHLQAMPVSPISAFETPLVLGGACDSLAEAFDADACSPLILNAVFTVDFLCIRPFEEGNGRISRLFAELMLEKAGFSIARYASIDRIIERAAMGYYDALNACVDKWDRAGNDYEPYVLYWLDAVHQAYCQLFDEIDVGSEAHFGKSERVAHFITHAEGIITKRRVLDAFPDISEATIENVLGKLVKEGAIEKIGAGRGTAYRKM